MPGSRDRRGTGAGEQPERPVEESQDMEFRLALARIEQETRIRELEMQREKEERDAQMQREREEREAQERRAQAEKEEREAQMQREHEYRMAQLQQGASGRDPGHGRSIISHRHDLAGFPKYSKGDNVDLFFTNFERACADFRVENQERMCLIRSQVSGVLADLCASMPLQDSKDYDLYKMMVKQKLGFTADYHRKQFRSMRKLHDETYMQLGGRMQRVLDSWLKEAEVTDLQTAINVIGLEQFYSVIPAELKWNIKDKSPKNIQQASEWMDKLVECRSESRNEGRGDFKKAPFPEKRFQPRRPEGERRPFKFTNNLPDDRPLVKTVVPKAQEEKETRSCYSCGRQGHLARSCLSKSKSGLKSAYLIQATPNREDGRQEVVKEGITLDTPSAMVALVDTPKIQQGEMVCYNLCEEPQAENWGEYAHFIQINGCNLRALRDSGAQISMLRKDLVHPDQYKNENIVLKGISGPAFEAPLVQVPILYGNWKGLWNFAVANDLPYACIIGNDLARKEKESKEASTVLVTEEEIETEQRDELMKVLPFSGEEMLSPEVCQPDPESFQREQRGDPELKDLWADAEREKQDPESRRPVKFKVVDGKLYREVKGKLPHLKLSPGQLVVPKVYRKDLLQVAHENTLGGHLGVNKTASRIGHNFYWPNMGKQISMYCRSCDTCQRIGNNSDKRKAPLCPMPIISEPFQRVSLDILGPFQKVTVRGARYILCIVDFATRYPEAIPLRNIETHTVANALMSVFCRIGFPKEILSDLGSCFTSHLMEELCKMCGIRKLTSTPYHPQTNGLVEKFNGTLTKMLKAYIHEHTNDWDLKLPHLLFAYRDATQESTGFSPFELLYGRKVRGPLEIVRDIWEDPKQKEPEFAVSYVEGLLTSIREALSMAHKNLEKAQLKQKTWYDKKARARTYSIGDEVLILNPLKQNKLEFAWQGPYNVINSYNKINYLIDKGEGIQRVVHVNMMKPYVRRVNIVAYAINETEVDQDVCFEHWTLNASSESTVDQVNLNDDLSISQTKELKLLLKEFTCLFSDKPGTVQGVQHYIATGTVNPIMHSPYRVTGAFAKKIEDEIQQMMEDKSSHSTWRIPEVLDMNSYSTDYLCNKFKNVYRRYHIKRKKKCE